MQPIETCTQAWKRRSRWTGSSAAKAPLLAGAERAASDALAAGAEPVAEVRDRAGPERDVDVRVELEQPLPLRLRVAAADGDDRSGPLALQLRRIAHVGGEARVGLLADRARVEDDHVRLVLRRRLAEPELLEQALDPLGVVRVHLAAERRDVVAAHGAKGSPAATRALRARRRPRRGARAARRRRRDPPCRCPGTPSRPGRRSWTR